MGVLVKRNVIVKAIVTDELKEQIREEMQHAIDEIDTKITQIDFRAQPQISAMQRRDIQQAMVFRQQVNQEKERLGGIRKSLVEKMAAVDGTELGDEVIRGTLDSYVELEEGDNVAEVLGGQEIIIKDDIVVEIRCGILAEDDRTLIISEA